MSKFTSPTNGEWRAMRQEWQKKQDLELARKLRQFAARKPGQVADECNRRAEALEAKWK